MAHYKLLIAWMFLLGMDPLAFAQQTENADATSREQAWKSYYQQLAANDYQFVWSDDELPLILNPQAIVNWTNPLEAGQIHGSTFVWENNGRPIVVGQFFSYLSGTDKRSLCHVFSTLTDLPCIGRRKGEIFWKPALTQETGWHVAKRTPVPSETRAGRLLQMRGLARQFEAYTDESSRGKRNLRLLTQPLYRSDAALKGLDCGLFAYVVGTDPELLILIECDLAQDAPVWRFRFVQSTRSTTVAVRDNQEIYRYENSANNPEAPSAVYLSRHGIEVIPNKFE